MVTQPRVSVDREAIAAFCERHNIRKLSLFGSVLRDDFAPESDVDVLVEFEPGKAPGWEFVSMQEELEALIGHPVDLNTPGFLSVHFRQRVLDAAQVIYERAG
jgi:predicted nucleotidyltransferase